MLEETGLAVGELRPLWSGPRPYEAGFPHTVTVHVFRGTTDASQQDVVVGEGRAMVFVPREKVLDRDLAVTTAAVLPLHLGRAGEAPGSAAEHARRLPDHRDGPWPPIP